jgi:hypothetical protein
MKFISFFVFPCIGAPAEWYWRGKTEVLGGKPVPVPLCPPQIPHGLTWDRTRASAVTGRQLTAWAMARQQRLQILWTASVTVQPVRPTWNPDSVLVYWLGHGLDDQWSFVRVPVWSRYFLFSTSSRPTLGPTQTFIQLLPSAIYPHPLKPSWCVQGPYVNFVITSVFSEVSRLLQIHSRYLLASFEYL